MITFGNQADSILDNGTERVSTRAQTKLSSKIEKVDMLGGGVYCEVIIEHIDYWGLGYFGICDGVLSWNGKCSVPINTLGLNAMNNDTRFTLHPIISGIWQTDISISREIKTIGIGINYINRVFYIIDDGEKVYNISIPENIDIDKMVYFYQTSSWDSYYGTNIWNFGTAPFIYNNPTIIIAHWVCTQNNNIYGIPS